MGLHITVALLLFQHSTALFAPRNAPKALIPLTAATDTATLAAAGADIDALGYRDLQLACKAAGLKATGKTEALRERLRAHVYGIGAPEAEDAPKDPYFDAFVGAAAADGTGGGCGAGDEIRWGAAWGAGGEATSTS